MDGSDPQRDAIHAALQESGPVHRDDRAAILIGWVVVTEWIDETGGRWLSKCHSSSLPHWLAAGLHHEALYGDWPDPDDDEDET